jgi:F0F1-type ATP synthase assembly protein I
VLRPDTNTLTTRQKMWLCLIVGALVGALIGLVLTKVLLTKGAFPSAAFPPMRGQGG